MVNTKSLLSNYTEFLLSRYIKLGDGNCVFAYGKGTMTIRSGDTDHVIDDVWYVPHINFNILSVSALTEQRYTVTFTDQYCTVTDVNCNHGLTVRVLFWRTSNFAKAYCMFFLRIRMIKLTF